MLNKLGIDYQCYYRDSEIVKANSCLIKASGTVETFHQSWKAVQNIFEWCYEVTHYTHQIVTLLQQHQPKARLTNKLKLSQIFPKLVFHSLSPHRPITHHQENIFPQ